MTLRGIPQGGVPVGMQNAVNGTVTLMNLTTLATGTAQGGGLLPSDYVIVTTATGSNDAVTLPDPNKYGGAIGDNWLIAVGQVSSPVLVYPPTGGSIDAGSPNASLSVAAGNTATLILQAFTATTSTWIADGGS
jgi:hypothetical protein